MDKLSDISYLIGCKERDTSAWNRFYRDFVSIVYKWVLFLGIGEANAEEITQEVFFTAYRRIDTCESDVQLKSWLFQITRKQAANYRRTTWFKRIWNSKKAELTDMGGARDHSGAEMRQLLATLPNKLTEVLLLHDLEGFTRDEIARILEIPPGTVASRLKQARQRFATKWWEEEK